MDPQNQLCPRCGTDGKSGKIRIHSQKEKRYRCQACQRTFSARHGTMYSGLKKSNELVTVVVALLAYGCPTQAIVAAYGLDPRTIAGWHQKAGQHCRKVHEQTVWRKRWDFVHVQADELKVKVQGGVVWITLAMMVATRLWLGAAVDQTRSKAMIVECLRQVAGCALCRPLLLAVDGFNMYQSALKKAFRAKHPVGKGGRMKYVTWNNVILTQLVKRRGNQWGHIDPVVSVGTPQEAQRLREASGGGAKINTAFIERFNATVRQRFAATTRRSRAAAKKQTVLQYGIFLMGTVYNFCSHHDSLALALFITPRRRHWVKRTPAMAAGLTDHRWTIEELLSFNILRHTS